MAGTNAKPKAKRQRKRKARTEDVSSASSSEDEKAVMRGKALKETVGGCFKDARSMTERAKATPRRTESVPREAADPGASATKAPARPQNEPTPTAPVPNSTDPTAPAFETFYLRAATAEFAEELDKIRSADDFDDASLPVLVNALRQGASLFSAEEQRRVLVNDATSGP
ncbi:MAG: hypothetical protein M1832_002930 [Thelocarpon impressellum]|nr:MAG: hypothetical protein M1832_002930 [Thelocarpon impressellum]